MAAAMAGDSSWFSEDFQHSEGPISPQLQTSCQEEGLRLGATFFEGFDMDMDTNVPSLPGRSLKDVAAADTKPSSPKSPQHLEPDLAMSLGLLFNKIQVIENVQREIVQRLEQLDAVKNGSPTWPMSGLPMRRSSSKRSPTSATSSEPQQDTPSCKSAVYKDKTPLTFRKQLWRFLEDRTSSRPARWYSHLVAFLIAIGVANYWSEFVEFDYFSPGLAMFQQVFFAVELVIRFAVCPARSAFLCNLYNWVDFITTLMRVPVMVVAVGGQDVDRLDPFFFKVFCPVLMMLKLLRRFQTFHLLLTAFREASQSLPLLMYTLFVIGSFFAAIIYSVEPRSNITSFGHAAWLVIVTMSTVGYGDVSASSTGGYIASSCMIIISSLYIAIPIGIIGNSFSTVWNDRHRLMTLDRIRNYIAWAGLSIEEVHRMLESVDDDGDARLTFDEFKKVLPILMVTLSDQAALHLFHSIDKKEEGVIDYSTFLGAVYPGQTGLVSFYKRRTIQAGRRGFRFRSSRTP